MKMPFLNRTAELDRLRKALASPEPSLIVVYGRRRCGKSRLLAQLSSPDTVYYLADMREIPLQIKALSAQIGMKIPEFDSVDYPDWESLLRQFKLRARPGQMLVLDEFPYLVKLYPPLESVIQKIVDNGPGGNLILCGSSQRMMHGLVLDASAPLYGRAAEIVKIDPLMPGWIPDALNLTGIDAFESYAVWGGVPRYWEAARDHPDLHRAMVHLVFDTNGIFHDEPARLLLDDARGASQPESILALIGAGCHRLSEIAARLGKPAANLGKPLAQLVDLGYVKRELPFGESVRSTRRSTYRIADPFLRFWYRFICPNRSLLEIGLTDQVFGECMKSFTAHVAGIWEECARLSAAFIPIGGVRWKPASRWWGPGSDRRPCEIDIVTESFDGRHVLLGEAKWEESTNAPALLSRLRRLAARAPFVRGREVRYAIWTKKPPANPVPGCTVTGPDGVLSHLRR